MTERQYTRITLQGGRVTSYYSEQETSNYCRVEVQFLRELREAGIVQGVEVHGEAWRYSDEDIVLLRRVRRLHEDLGVNLEGVDIILRLQAQLERLQRDLDEQRRGH